MYNIKISDLKTFADDKTIKMGEQLVSSNLFPLEDIKSRENPNRYDTIIYYIEWKDKEYSWYINRTQIEVDVEDNIVGFYSDCNCVKKYNHMCPHTIGLALQINHKNELKKEAMSEEEYKEYEDELIYQYEQRKQEYQEKIRQQQIKLNEKNFSLLLSEYDLISQKVMLAEKVGLDITISHLPQPVLSFKIGVNKKYIVKNIRDFLIAINNKELVRYGKELEFYHDIENFNDHAKKIIKLLLNKTSYRLEASYYYYVNNQYRYLKINNIILEDILSISTHNYITFNFGRNSQEVYISDRIYEGSIYVDEEKIILKDIHDYELFIGENKHFIIIDSICYELTKVSEVLKPIYKLLSKNKEIIIKDSLTNFLKDIYPIIYDEVELEYGFKDKHPVKEVKIDSYFDLDNDILEVKTKYYIGEKETNIDVLKKGLYSYSKLKEYQRYIDNMGFIEGKILDLNKITLFLKSDLSFLRKCGDVYLSDNIQRMQIKSMKKIVVNMNYEYDLFSIFFDDLGFTDEELYKIISEFRKKKRYVKLENDVIVELDERSMQEFIDVIDDFNLDVKQLSKKQDRPLYVAAKAFHKQNNDNISFNYNEKLKEVILKIKNYPENDYSVPKSLRKVLRNYQVDAFKWLKTLADFNFGGILADDMGLGKTLEIISFLLSDEKDLPSLIICPTSLIYNWKGELEKWAKSLKFKIVIGNANDRKSLIENIKPTRKLIYITSYDTFKNDVLIYKDINFRFVILDEAQFIKNYYTQKAKAVKEVNSEVRFVLTGTPIENSLLDLWSIFDFLLPNYLSNHTNFKNKFDKAINDQDNQESLAYLIKKITPFVLRRTKKSVLKDLPPKFETISFAQMDTDQRKLYEAYLLTTRTQLESGKTKFEILSNLTRLRQICVDPAIFLENYRKGSAKVTQALELINQSIENGHKILLFSQFTSLFPILEKELKHNKIKYYVLTGSTKAIDRVQMVDDFNENEEVKVFLISLKAGGTGLNLVGADIVIHFDPWWNVSVENQATDRAHRIGQVRSVQVIKLVCENSIEQKVIELQKLKKNLADTIISDDDGNIKNLDENDLQYILS